MFSLHVSVALAQNTTGVTTATTMAAAGGNVPMLLMDGRWPPKIVDVVFWGVEGVYAPQSTPLFQQWCIATTLQCFEGHAHPQQPQKLYPHAWGVVAHLLDHRSGAKGLMWGTRGPYSPAAAMVSYGCVGQWWQLEANVRSTYCKNSKNCLRKYFYYSYVDPRTSSLGKAKNYHYQQYFVPLEIN